MRILPAMFIFAIGGAAYIYHQEQAGETAPLSKMLSKGATLVESVIGEDSDDEADSTGESRKADGEQTAADNGSGTVELGDVFRFDITPEQLRQTSKRVNVNSPDGRLRGYRLPLVTGDSPQDISGSLAYYFEGTRARRITFTGSSGDPRLFLEFLSRQFGFNRVNSRNSNVETYSARSEYSGLLKLTPPAQPDGRSQLDLSIAR